MIMKYNPTGDYSDLYLIAKIQRSTVWHKNTWLVFDNNEIKLTKQYISVNINTEYLCAECCVIPAFKS